MATFKVTDPTPVVDDSTVPYEIRLGPAIEVWADPDLLRRFALLDKGEDGCADMLSRAMLSARGRHAAARLVWAEEVGIDREDVLRHAPSCRPYWLAEIGPPWRWGAH